ncbi:mitochondrial carrier domain-containing protein [Lipomyces kononenkoae]|uniref:Mitochondrial carrier domain-containing protein n=1 Tax=Lipomyces kononenkoae TaxID=34357 RepID=A0ACC3T7G0_LIPKO
MEDVEPHIIEAVEQKDSNDPLRVIKDLTAGTCGGIAQVLVGQPFDTTKVRLQSAPPGTYTGGLDVVQKLIKTEGPLAFYKGTLTPLVGVGACVSVQFGVFEGMKRFFLRQNASTGNSEGLTYTQYYVAGSMAGLANSILVSCPIEHIRIRLQTQTASSPKQFSGPMDVIRQIRQRSGIAGLFRGLTPTLLREGHGMGVYFLTYEYLVNRDMARNNIERKDIPGWRLCVYGGCAGYGVWLSAYPFDVIKSKMQTDSIDAATRQFSSTIDCARKTFQLSGIKGFFRGFVPTILRAAPVNASTFYAFELAMRAIG